MTKFDYRAHIRRCRFERGHILYDYIPKENLPLGIVLDGDRRTKLFIHPSAILHFHKQLLRFPTAYHNGEKDESGA